MTCATDDPEIQERRDWIKSLKVDDEVAMGVSSFFSIHYSIQHVTSTIDGKIKVTSFDGEFNEDGERGDYLIAPVSQYVLERIEREKLIDELDLMDFDNMKLDKLRRIMQVINE